VPCCLCVRSKTSEPPRYPPNVNPVGALGLVAPASSTSAAAAAGDSSTVTGVDNAAASSAAGAPDDTKGLALKLYLDQTVGLADGS